MVKAYGSDAGDGGFDDVGGIEAAAKPHLDDLHLNIVCAKK